MRAIVACVAVLAALTSRAAAQCEPDEAVYPAIASLPRKADVYVFLRAWRKVPPFATVREGRESLPVQVTVIGHSAGIAVRIHFEARRAGDTVDVMMGPAERVYRIEDDWRPDRVEVTQVDVIANDWDCTADRSVDFTLHGDAAAFRLDWTDEFGIDHAWLPPRTRSENTLGVGELSCVGPTVPKHAFDHHRYVRVSAVFADGSEHLVASPDLRIPPESSSDAPINTRRLRDPRVCDPHPGLRPKLPPGPSPDLVLLVCALMLAGVAGAAAGAQPMRGVIDCRHRRVRRSAMLIP
jgi:hypothetical protein